MTDQQTTTAPVETVVEPVAVARPMDEQTRADWATCALIRDRSDEADSALEHMIEKYKRYVYPLVHKAKNILEEDDIDQRVRIATHDAAMTWNPTRSKFGTWVTTKVRRALQIRRESAAKPGVGLRHPPMLSYSVDAHEVTRGHDIGGGEMSTTFAPGEYHTWAHGRASGQEAPSDPLQRDKINGILAALSTFEQDVARLTAEGRSISEIAPILGTTTGTARYGLKRIRLALRVGLALEV